MFGLFKSAPFNDPQLGELTRSRGHWRGSLALADGESVPLVLSGTKSEPDAKAIAVAKEVPAQFASWRATIEKELFGHYPVQDIPNSGATPRKRFMDARSLYFRMRRKYGTRSEKQDAQWRRRFLRFGRRR